MTGAQAPLARVPLADGTVVATQETPSDDLIPSFLAVSDVLGTGWYAADAARVQPKSTVAVVGDGAVGLMGVLAVKQMGAGGSSPEPAQDAAGPRARIRRDRHRFRARGSRHRPHKAADERRGGDSVLECVGTQVHDAGNSMRPAWRDDRLCRRPAWRSVRRPTALLLAARALGRPRFVRRFLPHLMDLVLERKINPGKVFDLTLPLADVAEGYRAMDERRAIKTLLSV